jgi:hypothetical protein
MLARLDKELAKQHFLVKSHLKKIIIGDTSKVRCYEIAYGGVTNSIIEIEKT